MRRRTVGVTLLALATGVVGLLLVSAGATADETERGAASSIKVNLGGTGSGKVVSTPAGIDCPGKCVELVEPGDQYTLRATPAAGSVFAGFGGACASTSTSCTFPTQQGSNLVSADFNVEPSGGNKACDKAKAKLAKKKKKLADLKADGASDSRIDAAKNKVKKAKAKKKEACG